MVGSRRVGRYFFMVQSPQVSLEVHSFPGFSSLPMEVAIRRMLEGIVDFFRAINYSRSYSGTSGKLPQS